MIRIFIFATLVVVIILIVWNKILVPFYRYYRKDTSEKREAVKKINKKYK